MIATYRHGKPNPRHQDTFFRKDGTPFPALISGTPLPGPDGTRNTVVECRDVTEETRSRQALEESEGRLRSLADSMPQHVWTSDTEGTIDYVNKQVCDYFGKPVSAILGNGWHAEVHPDDKERVAKVWKRTLHNRKPYQIEFRLRRADGTYRWFLSRAVPIKSDDGEVVKWIGSNTDIEELKSTARRRDELEKITRALKAQREELLALNQAKDEFISLASHQLRTPSSAVKQFLGMVLEGYVGEITNEQKTLLGKARISNDRQMSVVDDLLKVAKVDAGKVRLHKSPADLNDLTQEVLDEQYSKFKSRDQKIIFKKRAGQAVVRVDRDRIRMVLENIVDNASKYTPPGKTVSVSISSKKGLTCISVRDEGVGISQKDQDKLFKKFIRVDNPLSASVGGSGLGLYWAKKIVDLHEGTITVESEIGKGSTFSIILPSQI